MKNIATGQPENPFQVQWTQSLTADDAGLETGSVAVDRFDHQIRDDLAVVVPCAFLRQLWRHVLAEQRSHMRATRRQRIVQGRGDYHLNDGIAAPSERSCVAISTIHMVQAGTENNSRGMMRGEIASGERRETRQLRKGDVDPECAGAAAPRAHTTQEGRI